MALPVSRSPSPMSRRFQFNQKHFVRRKMAPVPRGKPKPMTAPVAVEVEAFSFEASRLTNIRRKSHLREPFPLPFVGRVVDGPAEEGTLSPGDRVVTIGDPFAGKLRLNSADLLPVPLGRESSELAYWLGAPRIALQILLQHVELAHDDWIVQSRPLSPIGLWVIRFAQMLRIRTINIVESEAEAVRVIAARGDVIVTSPSVSTFQLGAIFSRHLPSLAILWPTTPSLIQLQHCLPNSCHVVDVRRCSASGPNAWQETVVGKGILNSNLIGQSRIPTGHRFLDVLTAAAPLVKRPVDSALIVERRRLSDIIRSGSFHPNIESIVVVCRNDDRRF